jgi:Fic family protein
VSQGEEGPLLCAPDAKANLEARNGVEQLDYITELVEAGARELRESHVLELQDIAIRDVYPCGGKYRTALHNVFIANSAHTLPEAAFVPSLVRDAVDWINRQRGQRSALERAAYALWRFNWIHPFAGGNGRTSRAVAYLVVCMDAGRMLPGVPSMPSLIYDHRDDYLVALRAVDASLRNDNGSDAAPREPDTFEIVTFLKKMLTRQLASVIDRLASP